MKLSRDLFSYFLTAQLQKTYSLFSPGCFNPDIYFFGLNMKKFSPILKFFKLF